MVPRFNLWYKWFKHLCEIQVLLLLTSFIYKTLNIYLFVIYLLNLLYYLYHLLKYYYKYVILYTHTHTYMPKARLSKFQISLPLGNSFRDQYLEWLALGRRHNWRNFFVPFCITLASKADWNCHRIGRLTRESSVIPWWTSSREPRSCYPSHVIRYHMYADASQRRMSQTQCPSSFSQYGPHETHFLAFMPLDNPFSLCTCKGVMPCLPLIDCREEIR